MSSKRRCENYITEYVFVPLYNRSRLFRELIAKKFNIRNNPDGFGKNMYCTCDDKKSQKSKRTQYGNPDAITNTGNYVEVKTRLTTKLTSQEKDRGNENGSGYKNYITKNEKLLLYVLPYGYDAEEVVKNPLRKIRLPNDKVIKVKQKQVAIIYWSEILSFLKNSNITDPFIQTIIKNVDCDDKNNEIWTFNQYSAKIYELCFRLIQRNINFKLDFDETKIDHFPYNSKNDWNWISFCSPNGEVEDLICFNDYYDKNKPKDFGVLISLTAEEKNKVFMKKYEYEWDIAESRFYKHIMSHERFIKSKIDILEQEFVLIFEEWWKIKNEL